MFKKFAYRVLSLIVLLVIALCLLLSPVLSTHAAGLNAPAPTSAHHIATPQQPVPLYFWRP